MHKTHEDRLLRQMEMEYQEFLERLKTQPAEQIIDRAYEKVRKEDILCLAQSGEFSAELIRVLEHEKYPLDHCYQSWLRTGTAGLEGLLTHLNEELPERRRCGAAR